MAVLRTALIFCFLVAFSPLAFAQSQKSSRDIDPEKIALINQMLEVSGAVKIAKSNFDFMISGAESNATPEVKEILESAKAQFDPSKLVDLYIPIYDRHYSKDDLRGILEFYNSPLGKKLLKEMPAVTHEAVVAGQQWAANMMADLQKKMEAKKAQ